MKRNLLVISLVLTTLASFAGTNVVLQEGFESGTMPAGWTQEYVSLPITLGVDTAEFSWHVEKSDSGLLFPSGAASGTARVAARNNSANEMRFVTRLVSPVINLQGVFQPQLLFSHAEVSKAGVSDTLKVYYRTSATDYWHLFSDATFSRTTAWKQAVLPVVAQNATYQIAFEITENFGRGVVLDDIIVRATPTCQSVSNIVASQIHAFDAFLSWDANGAYNEFQVMLSPERLSDPEHADMSRVQMFNNIYNPEVHVSNLTPQTTYYAYVRTDCDENESGFTEWVESSFRTLTVAYLPYSENFDNTLSFSDNTFYGLPEGWSTGSDTNTRTPFVFRTGSAAANKSYSVDSTHYLAFAADLASTPEPLAGDQYAYAVTPEVGVSSLQGMEVSFWATAAGFLTAGVTRYAASLTVGVMSDAADLRTFVAVDTINIESSWQFKRFTVSLENYTGKGKYIALLSRSDERNAIFVDNFKMYMPATTTPSDVRLSNVSHTGFKVNANTHDADSWSVIVSTQYSRDGKVDPTSILFSQSNIQGQACNVVIGDGSMAGQVVMVYVRASKNGTESECAFPVTVRIPGLMAEVTDSVPVTFSFDNNESTLLLSQLNNEVRMQAMLSGASSVYYPLTSAVSETNNYPKIATTMPNYKGSHLQLAGEDTWFVLPEVSGNVADLKLVFRYATLKDSHGAIDVGIMTDPYDLTTFEKLASFTAEDAVYRRSLVSLDAYTGSGKFIAFVSRSAGASSFGSCNLIDEIVISKLGTCREAANIEVEAHASSALITWNGGGMDAWIVGVSPINTMFNAEYKTVTTPSVSFDNLEQLSTYYFTIQTICNGDTVDLDDVLYSFETTRGMPFTESFSSSSLPDGWSRATGLASDVFSGGDLTATTSGWTFSSSYTHAPQAGYGAQVYVSGTTCKYWLISPVLNLDVAPGQPMELLFDLGVHSSSTSEGGADDKFMVIVSEDGGNTWRAANATIWSNDGHGDYSFNDLYWEGAQTVTIDFTKYAGKRIQFAFYAESTTSNESNYVIVDNVLLRLTDVACGGLTNLTAVVSAGGDAVINWALNGVNPYPAILQVSTSSSFNKMLVNDTLQATSYTLSNLQSRTLYHVRARQNCDNDSHWQTVTFRTACDPMTLEEFGTETFTSESSAECWVSGFAYDNGSGDLPQRVVDNSFGAVMNITKSSTNTSDPTVSDGAYVISPELLVGDTINKYQITFDACTYSTAATNVGRIVVGIVSDPADAGNTFERVAEIKLANATDSLSMRTYVISFEDYTGDLDGNFGHYCMFLSEAGADSTNFVYIDNVFLEPAQGCHQVFDISADTLTSDGASFHWSGNGVQYEVAVTDVLVRMDTVESTPILRHGIVDTTYYRVNGFEASTLYFIYVRAICGEGDTAHWSSGTRFKTAIGVPFEETFGAGTFDTDVWGRYSLLFSGDSVLGSNFSPLTTGYTAWQTTEDIDLKGISGMEGYAVRSNIYGTNEHSWLVSPLIDLSKVSDAEILLSFKAALVKYSGTAAATAGSDDRLGVMLSFDDGETWKASDATFVNITKLGANAQKYQLDFTEYSGKAIRFAFYAESTVDNQDNYIYLDSISLVRREAICLGVRHFGATMQNDTTVSLTWEIYGTPDSVLIELSPDADFQKNVRTAVTDADNITLSGLSYNTTYYARATQVGCDNSSVVSFSTPRTTPFAEDFSASSLPSDWLFYRGNAAQAFRGDTLPQQLASSHAWKISTSKNGLPANHLLGELYKASAVNEAWLVSPDLVLLAEPGEEIVMGFNLALTKHNAATAPEELTQQAFRVMLSLDNGESWEEENSWLFSEADDAYMKLSNIAVNGEQINIDLSAYAGERVRVAFYKESSNATADNDLHISNLRIELAGEICNAPTNLRHSAVSFTTALISWDGDPEVPTVIEYSRSSDFAGALKETVASGNTHTLTGLVSGKTYYVRAQNICSEVSKSEYSNTDTLTTSLGLPYYQPFANSIEGWSKYTGTLETVFGGGQLTSSTSGWTATSDTKILGEPHIYCKKSRNTMWLVSPSLDLTPNNNDPLIALSFDMSFTKSETNGDAPSVNNNQAFYVLVSEDDGATWTADNCWTWSRAESAQYNIGSIPTGEGKNYTINFRRFGGKKIKVALVMGGASGTTGWCINIKNLALETYSSLCFGVSNVLVSNIDTAANVTITPNDSASLWEYAYGFADDSVSAMPHYLSDNTSFRLTGLKLTSTYDIYVRSICGAGDSSAWTGPFRFDTPLGLNYNDGLQGTLSNWKTYSGIVDSVYAGKALTSVSTGWSATQYSTTLGTAHVYCPKNSLNDYWLVSPEINMMPQTGDKSIWLSFDLALTNSYSTTASPVTTTGHSFKVIVSDDAGATWKAANTFSWGDKPSDNYVYSEIPNDAGQTIHLDITRFAGKSIRVAFVECHATDGASCIHLANAEVAEYSMPCFGISNLHAEVSGLQVHGGFKAGTNDASWQYLLVKQGASFDDSKAVNINDTIFTIPKVDASSSYNLYARAICGPTDTSAWAGPVSFKTAIGIRYEESFNWSAFSPDWESLGGTLDNLTTTTSSAWTSGKPGKGFPDNHATVNIWSSNKRLLVSPEISIGTDMEAVQLSIDLALTKWDQTVAPTSIAGQSFYVLVSTNGSWSESEGWEWSSDPGADFRYGDIPTTGRTYTLDLTDYIGEKIRLGFYAVATGQGADNDLHIANLVLDSITPSSIECLPVTRMAVNDSSYTSANVTFKARGIRHALNLEYACLEAGKLATPKNIKAATLSSDTNVVTISGLSPSSSYHVYARTQCADSSWTEWTGPFYLRTIYCSDITGIASAQVSLYEATVTLETPNPEAALAYQAAITDHGDSFDDKMIITSKTNTMRLVKDMMPTSTYDVYARKICMAGDTSAWVGPFEVKSPYGIPYEDDLNWASISPDWKTYSDDLDNLTSGSSGWTTGRAGNGFEDVHVYVNTWSSYKRLLVTPEITLNTSSAEKPIILSFDLALTKYNNSIAPTSTAGQSFYVLVSTDGTWNLNRGWSWKESGGNYLYSDIPTDGETYEIDLSAYAGRPVRIGFYAVSTGQGADNDLHLRNFSISENSDKCKGIDRDITFSDMTLTSVSVSFSYKDKNLGNLEKCAIYELSDDRQFTNVLLSDTVRQSETFSVNGLSASTTYYVRLMQICGDNETSAWSSPKAFTTPLGIRYIEDFNSGLNGWTFSPKAFGRDSASTSNYWSRYSSSTSIFPTPHIRMNVYSVRCGWAISPTIDLTPNAGEGLLLAFDAALCAYSGLGTPAIGPDDKFIVGVSYDDGETWEPENAVIWSNDGLGDHSLNGELSQVPQRIMLDFSKHAGKTIRLGFYAESTVSNADNYMQFDNIDLNSVEQNIYFDTICQESDFAGHGYEYTAEQLHLGLNSFTHISQNFDSLTVLNIYVLPIATDTVHATLCEGELYSDNGYNLIATQSDVYRHMLTGSNGCDSILYLDLNVIPKERVTVDMEVCAGTAVTINGKTYYNNAVAIDTLSSAVSGCDSIVTYYLTFSDNATYNVEITRIICAGETYDDGLFRYSVPGVYTKTTTSVTGCDSTVTLTLLQADASGMLYDTISVEELPYIFMGKTFIEADSQGGDYSFPLEASCGVATLSVHVTELTALPSISGEGLAGKVEKLIINGHLYIRINDVLYDATGRLVRQKGDLDQ